MEQASRLAKKTKIFDAICQPSFFLKKEFIDAFVLLFDCVKSNEVKLHLKSNVKILNTIREVFSSINFVVILEKV